MLRFLLLRIALQLFGLLSFGRLMWQVQRFAKAGGEVTTAFLDLGRFGQTGTLAESPHWPWTRATYPHMSREVSADVSRIRGETDHDALANFDVRKIDPLVLQLSDEGAVRID